MLRSPMSTPPTSATAPAASPLSAAPAVAIAGLLVLLTSGCGDPPVECPTNYVAQGTNCVCLPPFQQNGILCEAPSTQCPAGTVLQGGACVPTGGGDAGAGQDAGEASDTVGTPDSGGAPDAGGGTDDSGQSGGEDTSNPPDMGQPDTSGPPKNPVGKACNSEFDCANGFECFNWPKGYCTQLSCSSSTTPCPGASICWSLDDAVSLCSGTCEIPNDCRGDDGYACKRLTSGFGGIDAGLCLPEGEGVPGAGCSGPLDCDGEATCVTDIAGGYCARIGCSTSDPCPADTACVLRSGKPTCLRTCVLDSECKINTNAPRKCVERADISKKVVQVCLDVSTAAPIGGSCLNDLDCESGKCTIVAKGTCQTGGQPCLDDTACGALGPCVLAPEKEIGQCTSPCSSDDPCPTGGVCVPGSGGTSGTCSTSCKGPGDDEVCGPLPNLKCIIGQPIPPFGTNTPKSYACAPVAPKGAGADCTVNADCDSNFCIANAAGTAGYCAAYCGAGQPLCPFGMVCTQTGISFCQKLCNDDFDCPPAMACVDSGLGDKICQIP